jgi:hypothetical protein
MHKDSPAMRGLLIVASLAAALGVSELPVDEFSKLGVTGAAIALAWWMVAKTMPAIVETNARTLAEVVKTHAESLEGLASAHKESAAIMSSKMDAIKDAIHQSADSEANLLKSMILEQRKTNAPQPGEK